MNFQFFLTFAEPVVVGIIRSEFFEFLRIATLLLVFFARRPLFEWKIGLVDGD